MTKSRAVASPGEKQHDFPPGGAPLELLAANGARWYVPSGYRKVAARSLREFTNATTVRARIGRSLAARGVELGFVQHAPSRRVRALLGSTDSLSGASALAGHLRDVFDREDIELAITFGPSNRPNRKPIARVITRGGELLGYVKLGSNELTRSLVAHEAAVLRRLELERRPRAFAVPRVIHFSEWDGMTLLAITRMETGFWRTSSRARELLPVEATRELCGLFGTTKATLAESEYWDHTRRRYAATSGRADASRPLGEALAWLEERHGREPLSFGFSHGDWTPWNMARTERTLAVWDWERSRDGIPVGVDAVHYLFTSALRRSGGHWPAAVAATLDRFNRVSSLLRLPSDAGSLLLCLDLVELVLRFEEARQVGVDAADDIYEPALAHLVTKQR